MMTPDSRATVDIPDPPPRIPQITEAEHTDDIREVLAIFEAGANNNIVKTFAQHPALAKPFLTYNRYLLRNSTLPVRLRQITILRATWVRRTPYSWSSHLRMSMKIGMTGEDFEAVKQGADSPHWSELERLLITAVDQLGERSTLTDATWAALSQHLDHRQMLDFVFTVGTYTLLAMVFNAAGIEREPELRELARRFGAPEPPST